jgi:hypothetical protein
MRGIPVMVRAGRVKKFSVSEFGSAKMRGSIGRKPVPVVGM